MSHPFGRCVLVSVNSLSHLVTYFQSTIHQIDSTPFEVKGFSVTQVQLVVSQLPSNTNTTSHKISAKEHMNETEIEKHLRLENTWNTNNFW